MLQNPSFLIKVLIFITKRFYYPSKRVPGMAFRHFLSRNKVLLSPSPSPFSGFANFSSKSSPYLVKVGIPEFLNAIGKGVEAHAATLESEIGDLQKLLVTRTMRLKRIEPKIPCQHRKLILKYAHKYRLGLWRPRAEPVKSK